MQISLLIIINKGQIKLHLVGLEITPRKSDLYNKGEGTLNILKGFFFDTRD